MMITIFNRKELLVTWDFNERHRIVGCLIANDIKYVSRSSGGSGRTYGGIGPYHSCQYYIYVHKDDYECAKNATGLR